MLGRLATDLPAVLTFSRRTDRPAKVTDGDTIVVVGRLVMTLRLQALQPSSEHRIVICSPEFRLHPLVGYVRCVACKWTGRS
jgi:hypothetical protein